MLILLTGFSFSPSTQLLKIVLIVLQYVAWPESSLQTGEQCPMLIKSMACASWGSVCMCVWMNMCSSQHLTACTLETEQSTGLPVLLIIIIIKILPFDPSWCICLISFYVEIKQVSECVIWTSIQEDALIFMRTPSSIIIHLNLCVLTFICCITHVLRTFTSTAHCVSALFLHKLKWLAGVWAQ